MKKITRVLSDTRVPGYLTGTRVTGIETGTRVPGYPFRALAAAMRPLATSTAAVCFLSGRIASLPPDQYSGDSILGPGGGQAQIQIVLHTIGLLAQIVARPPNATVFLMHCGQLILRKI